MNASDVTAIARAQASSYDKVTAGTVISKGGSRMAALLRALADEVDRLQEVAEEAFHEGVALGLPFERPAGKRALWRASEARKAVRGELDMPEGREDVLGEMAARLAAGLETRPKVPLLAGDKVVLDAGDDRGALATFGQRDGARGTVVDRAPNDCVVVLFEDGARTIGHESFFRPAGPEDDA